MLICIHICRCIDNLKKKFYCGMPVNHVCGGSIYDDFKHNALHHMYNYKFQINLHVLYKADLLFTYKCCNCYN